MAQNLSSGQIRPVLSFCKISAMSNQMNTLHLFCWIWCNLVSFAQFWRWWSPCQFPSFHDSSGGYVDLLAYHSDDIGTSRMYYKLSKTPQMLSRRKHQKSFSACIISFPFSMPWHPAPLHLSQNPTSAQLSKKTFFAFITTAGGVSHIPQIPHIIGAIYHRS